MTDRAQIVLNSREARDKAARWIQQAPPGTRLDFRGPQRSIEQNDRMWAMLTDIATQKTLSERRWTADQWKVVFLTALGRETQFIPDLEGKFIPYGQSSSALSKHEMSNLIDFMLAWGAENGVIWSDPSQKDAAA